MNGEVGVDDVLELDVERLVLVARDHGDLVRVALRFAPDGSCASEARSSVDETADDGARPASPTTDLCGAPNLVTEVHRRMAAAFNAGDTDAYLALFADDVVFHLRRRRALVRGRP